jgi:RimJ/RimL family protein N-acetyltransferase
MALEQKTESLILRPINLDDVDFILSLNSNPVLWTHLPCGLNQSRAHSQHQVEEQMAGWAKFGLGYWIAMLRDRTPVGVGGCAMVKGLWNVYYRLDPNYHGKGYATELAEAGISAAIATDANVPVTAYLLQHNLASKRIIEKLGLSLVWTGPAAGNPDPAAVRLIYADRLLSQEVLSRFCTH